MHTPSDLQNENQMRGGGVEIITPFGNKFGASIFKKKSCKGVIA